jgi:hypothetical protein
VVPAVGVGAARRARVGSRHRLIWCLSRALCFFLLSSLAVKQFAVQN